MRTTKVRANSLLRGLGQKVTKIAKAGGGSPGYDVTYRGKREVGPWAKPRWQGVC